MRVDAPFLILRHEPFEHLGYFESFLEENQVAYEYHDLDQSLPHDEYSALIVMGGPMSVNDDLAGLRTELELIEKALGEDRPVLGICLGSQMIAKTLGAKVYSNAELELGWAPVWGTAAAKSDPVFSGLRSPEMFFHWHGETFDLPPGAEWLAHSERCKHQAYRYGHNVYGIQFHPEITPEMIEDWCRQPVNCGDVSTLRNPIDPHLHDTREASRRILQSWLDLF